MDIEKSVALVTGGASGLGAATVQALVGGGGRAVIVDRDAATGQELARSIGSAVRFVAADVTNEEDIRKAIATAREAFGGLNVTVNCAGVGVAAKTMSKRGPFPLELFRKCIEVNLIGTFNVIRLAAEAMVEQAPNEDGERGVIVNTASVAAFEGQVGQAGFLDGFAQCNFGWIGFTFSVAAELEPDMQFAVVREQHAAAGRMQHES